MNSFDASATDYHHENAYWLGRAALLAYEEEDDVGNKTADWGMTSRFFSSNGTQAFVASNNDFVVVSFRGTEPDKLEDILADLKFFKTDAVLGGKVHLGFHNALDEVWTNVKPHIANLIEDSPSKSLWFTGHSLGAALATLAVGRWLAEGRPVSGLYTFGSPRCGDKIFAKLLNDKLKARVFRHINNNDVVTRIPAYLQGYRHVGLTKYFDENGELHDGQSLWVQITGALAVMFRGIKKLLADCVEDHDMGNYVQNLDQARQSN